jgi:hypothetical protein
MMLHFPFTTLVAMQKNCPDLRERALDRSLEIIYNARNTPAVGVNFIQAPNTGMISAYGQRKWPHPHPIRAKRARAFVRQLSGDQTERGIKCPNP